MMLQYCRYCNFAFDCNGEGTDFLCTAVAPCGNNGAGAMYPAAKAKRANMCKSYEHNGYDIFRTDVNGKPVAYKPQIPQQCDYVPIKADWAK